MSSLRRSVVVGMVASGTCVVALPATALARGGRHGGVRPLAGRLYVGEPFANSTIRFRVARDGHSMSLVGEFVFSYGCSIVGNYGFADPQTLSHPLNSSFALMAPPKIAIKPNGSFSGSRNDVNGYRTISGRFRGAGQAASAAFSYAQPAADCGTFTQRFTLHVG